MGAGNAEWMKNVYRLCDKLHAVADPRYGAFRPPRDTKDKDIFRSPKRDLNSNYSNDRIKELNERRANQ